MNVDDRDDTVTETLLDRTLVLARNEPVLESDEYWEHVQTLHLRAGRDVFEAAVRLCANADPIARAVGANILAQLGVRDGVAEHPFADESAPVLVGLLSDTEPQVTSSALHA